MIFIVALFIAFGSHTQTLQNVNEMCKASNDSGSVCQEVAKKTVSTNETPLGIDE